MFPLMSQSEELQSIYKILDDGFKRVDARLWTLEERIDNRFDILQNTIINHGTKIAILEKQAQYSIISDERRDKKISLLSGKLEHHSTNNLTQEIKIKTAWKTLAVIASVIVSGSAFLFAILKYFGK